jgi:hypothetical protein
MHEVLPRRRLQQAACVEAPFAADGCFDCTPRCFSLFFLSSHCIAKIGKTAPERTLTYPVGSHGQLGMHYKKRSD